MGESETLREKDRCTETKTCRETGRREERRQKIAPERYGTSESHRRNQRKRERETQDLLVRQPLRDFQR